MRTFQWTVSALVYSLVRERCPEDARAREFLENRVVRFVLAEHARMPDYLRLPIRLATLLFDAYARITTLRAFHRLPHERRVHQIRAWRLSCLAPAGDLVKFYESLSVYGWYSAAEEGGR
jgi:hypothetical protein